VRHGCLTRNRVLGNEIVTLNIGPERKQFTVHKKLLCDRCEFFSKAFRGNFREAEKGEMYLPEDDPDAFSPLVDYLYRGVLPEAKDNQCATLLVKLYILAEKLCLSRLMDKACDAVHSYSSLSGRLVTPNHIAHIYSRTHGGSKLRKFCAGQVAYVLAKARTGHFGKDCLDRLEDCPDFFMDVFRWQVEHGKKINMSRESKIMAMVDMFGPCEFHTHGDKEECYLNGAK
jgi:hypothetical protein